MPEKPVNTTMQPGQNPDDFLFVLEECRDLPAKMGQMVHDERYDEIILQALPPEYERVRTASYERRDFGLEESRHMVHTMYVDYLSRSLSRLQAAALPCRWWGTLAVTYSATTCLLYTSPSPRD